SAALERLRFAVRTLPGILARFSEAESEQRPAPDRWTKKEVLGHLIESASNNHQRFVRGQIAAGQTFPGYEQERWVHIQDYHAARWGDLIDSGGRTTRTCSRSTRAACGNSLPCSSIGAAPEGRSRMGGSRFRATKGT